jgi:uncharacterized damage-inducible protein DinB
MGAPAIASPNSPTSIVELHAELERAGSAFRACLDSLPDSSWRKPSTNPAWTNGQVLFHIALAFILLPPLVSLARVFGRLPPRFSQGFAAVLDAGTGLFNWVNGLGPIAAGTVYNRARLRRKFEAVYTSLQRILPSLDSAELRRGMYYPHQWDSLFRDYMTLEEVIRYPAVHMRFHLGQLSP